MCIRDRKKKEKVKLEVLDSDGKIIRTVKYDVEPGVNRIYWDLRRKGVRSPNAPSQNRMLRNLAVQLYFLVNIPSDFHMAKNLPLKWSM